MSNHTCPSASEHPPLTDTLSNPIYILLSTLGLTSLFTAFPSLSSVSSVLLLYPLLSQYLPDIPSPRSLFTTSLLIDEDDYSVHLIFLTWLKSQTLIKNTRNNSLTSAQTQGYFDSDDEDDTLESPPSQQEKYTYIPQPGYHLFWYNYRPILMKRTREADKGSGWQQYHDRYELITPGRSPRVLKELMREIQDWHHEREQSRTVIYRNTSSARGEDRGLWRRTLSRYPRPLETVVLQEDLKTRFVEDVKEYLKPKTARWYARRGIPYRRGYLFYGPPGTGKSSLSLAVAGELKLKIYVVGFGAGRLDEHGLAALFAALPTRCIVLLEDIDAAFVKRETLPDMDVSPTGVNLTDEEKGRLRDSSGQTGVSFSGLLNVLDGVASQEGRILILTTNHIEKLDPALIRPGRVDMKIEFKMADKAVMRAMFMRMFQAEKDKEEPGEKEEDEQELARQAELFAEKVPEFQFSPAEIQGYLLDYKNRPTEAVEKALEWTSLVLKQREDEKKKAEGRPVEGPKVESPKVETPTVENPKVETPKA